MHSSPRQSVAIIGSGISGLVAAERLYRHFDIKVFEAGEHVGGHTNTIKVDLEGETLNVDTGFIVFNPKNYPRFTALLDRFEVATQPTSMSFSVRCDQTGLEYNGSSINGLLAKRTNALRPAFWRMLKDIFRFNKQAPLLLDRAADDVGPTVQQYIEENRYSNAFYEKYLVPLGTALWSTPATTFKQFPMKFVVQFLQNHFMLQVGGRPEWRVIQGGSCQYVSKLTAGFTEHILLNTPVRSVFRTSEGVYIAAGNGPTQRFDHVIIACHADQALRLVQDISHAEQELLGAFPYQPNTAVLHTDESVLPRKRRAWSSWNAYLPDNATDRVSVTYNMNILQSLKSAHTFCVTLNDAQPIDESKIIRRIRYHHPIYTREQQIAQARHGELINQNRTSYCGAYWGFGFHEDGVRSGERVAEALLTHAMTFPMQQEVAHA